ncbi:MAG: UDP-3-O-(3-hydroxymyristoyl)glucosamine N-acyltransferase [Brevinematia bacterium]
MKLSELAVLLGGRLCGNDIEVSGISDLEIQLAGTIAYVENKKYLKFFENSIVSALLLPAELTAEKKPYLSVEKPKEAFARLLDIFNKYKELRPLLKESEFKDVLIEDEVSFGSGVYIYPFTTILMGSVIGENTIIYSNCFIGRDVKIGKNCLIKSGVKIDCNVEIGDNVIIHHNAVIGGDGFGYYQENGKSYKIPQIGKIRIGNDVEIGAGVTIDRATIGETVIGNGVKIDNLVHIAHNVKIGDNSVIVAQVGIAGSTKIGKSCILAGQVGVADHVEMGDNVIVLAQSGIESGQKINSGEILFGTPAKPAMQEKRIEAALLRLPDLLKRVSELEKKSGQK